MKRPLFLMSLFFIVLVFTGCPEAEQMIAPVITDEQADTEPTTTVGEVKEPEETPATEPVATEPTEPEEPVPLADTTPPTVVEVAWYSDWQMTQPLTSTSTVRPGDTIYTTVTFSELVTHTIADDETARPALFIVTDSTTTRYKMLPHGVSFQSGEAKPLHGGTDDYLCKYTVPADIVGTITLRVAVETTDTAGNTVAEESEHIAPFMVIEPIVESPMITEPEPTVTLPPSYELPAGEEEDYTYTVEGEVYPGFNPSPRLQHILETHPSAELPYFLEAVKMTEVIDWAWERIWEAYPDDEEWSAATKDLFLHFGITFAGLPSLLHQTYYEIYPAEIMEASKYWYTVEYLRLKEVYPYTEFEELFEHYIESVKNGLIVGTRNPNNFSD